MPFRSRGRKIIKRLRTIRNSDAARFSQYHIPLIPEQSTLLQLDSVLRPIRPENLHELRDVFHANYETMIDMAAFMACCL